MPIPLPLDIFFTQSYQYVLEEDVTTVSARLASFLSRTGGTALAENSFRFGHPWGRLAYLSGSLDAMAPLALPGDPPIYRARTLVDVRIRPNLFLVLTTYCVTLLLILDMMGIELFWKSHYLIRLTLLCALEVGAVWAVFFLINQLRRQFEALM